MNHLRRLVTVLAVAWLAACNSAPTTAPSALPTPAPTLAYSGFTVSYETGSVPPPFNYTYEITGTFEANALNVSYILTYQFRDVLTPAEITSQGYTQHDDIDWTGTLTGAAYDSWRKLVSETTLGPIPPLAPGADSFSVTLSPIQGGEAPVGVPTNRDAWQTAITALDKQARMETGATRTEP